MHARAASLNSILEPNAAAVRFDDATRDGQAHPVTARTQLFGLRCRTEKFLEERKELNKQFSEERTKLAQIHADERKSFYQRPK